MRATRLVFFSFDLQFFDRQRHVCLLNSFLERVDFHVEELVEVSFNFLELFLANLPLFYKSG